MRITHLVATGIMGIMLATSACSQSAGGDGRIRKEDVGTLAGGAGGALLGAQFGKGSGNVAAIAAGTLKGDLAVDDREQRVVAAALDVVSRMELGTALTHENRSARHQLTAEGLDAQVLRIAVAAVSRTAQSFFMSHVLPSLRVDRRDQAESLGRTAVRRRLPVSVKDATQRRSTACRVHKSGHAARAYS